MKKTLCLTVLALCLALSSPALAKKEGGETGGGGNAVVCRDANQKIIGQPEFLDLVEGELRYSIKPVRSYEPAMQQIRATLDYLRVNNEIVFKQQFKLLPQFYPIEKQQDHIDSSNKKLNWFSHAIYQAINAARYLPTGVKLFHVPDLGSSHAVPIPDGCTIEQLAYYDANNTLTINTQLYELMPETDKAAFWLHEASYALYRGSLEGQNEYFPRGSSWVRHFVAQLMQVRSGSQPKAPEDYYGNEHPTSVFNAVIKSLFMLSQGASALIILDDETQNANIAIRLPENCLKSGLFRNKFDKACSLEVTARCSVSQAQATSVLGPNNQKASDNLLLPLKNCGTLIVSAEASKRLVRRGAEADEFTVSVILKQYQMMNDYYVDGIIAQYMPKSSWNSEKHYSKFERPIITTKQLF